MQVSIFNLSLEIRDAVNAIIEANNQENQLEAIKEILATKADQVFAYNEELEAYISILNSKIGELEERLTFVKNKKSTLDGIVINFLEVTNQKSISSGAATITAKKPLQTVEIYDETQIPVEFIHVPEPKPVIMKAQIKDKLKMGEIIDGARLVDGKKTLMYKLK